MKGVVLCGGHSSRMNDDKGLLLFQGKTWAHLALEKLSALNIATAISVNKNQIPIYTSYFKDDQLITDDNDFIDIGGPLVGVLSSHKVFPTEDLLVLACDFPKIDTAILQYLLDQHRSDVYEVVCYKVEDQVQPLCAIYTATGLAKILLAYQNKTLRKNSMMHVLEQLRTNYLDVALDWIPYFKNFNAAADLDFL